MHHNGRIGSFAMLFAPPHRSYGARVRVGPQWQEAGSRMPMVRNAGKGVQRGSKSVLKGPILSTVHTGYSAKSDIVPTLTHM